jgi:parallel beta-helix repeat protein
MNTKTIVLVGLVLSFCSARAVNYYVNDGSTNADVFCSAPGATTNTGLTPSSPKSSLSDVLAAHTLGPGDTVFLDTGNYTNGPSIVIGPPHGGSAALGLVLIKGAGSTKTLLVNTNLGAYGLQVSGASYLRVEGVAFRGVAQGVRVENSSHVELAGCEIAYCSYGVVCSGGSDHRVENCAIHHNGHQAVLASYSSSLVINGNAIYAQTGSPADNHGIDLSYNCNSAQITGNTITNNGGRGITIYSCSTPSLQGNLISGNGAEAIYLQSCASAFLQDQTVWLNANGIRAYYCPSLTLGGSRIYSNTGYGVSVEGGAVSAVNNLIYANGGQGFTLLNSPQSTIENNTFYRNATVSLRLAGSHNNVRVANNIISSAGAAQTCIQFDTIGTSWFADYNDYFITNGAVLWNWKGPRYSLSALQTYSSLERHSIDRDPLFVDPDGADNVLGGAGGADDNFHLATNSPALDAGDPTSDYAAEPAPNGSRINLGHLGGTAQADTSGNQRILRLLSPNGGEIAFRRTWVRWAATGPWSTNDLVKIEYSANNGGSWTTAANAAALNNANGFYGWDLSAITPGTAYLMRVSSVDQPTITDRSDAAFEIQSPAAKVIYINDGSTANDTWCSAIGATANTGLSAASPLDSFQSVIEHYPAIGAGDEIRVDTGVFDLGRTVYLNQQSSGAAEAPLVIRGSTSGAAIFNRADQSEDTFLFDGVSYVWFERLQFTLGVAGLRVAGTGLNPSVGITMKDCQTYSNSSVGIIVSTCSNLLVQGCSSWRNGGDGFSLPASNATVTNNVALWNGGNGLAISGSGSVDGNVASSNSAWGINVSGFFQVRTNTSFRNYYGLFVASSTTSALTVSDNECRDNSDVGLQVNGYGSSYLLDAVNNRSYGNGNDGLRVNGGALARRNVVFNNGGQGIRGGGGGETLRNNLIYSNAQWNVYVDGTGCATVFENNTLYGGNGLSLGFCCFGGKWFTNQNNIFRVMGSGKAALEVRNWPVEGFVSDYNDYYVTDGAVVANWQGSRPTLSAWQQITALDPNSLAIDPRFVDASTNFHLRSTSGSYRGAPFTAPGGGSFVTDAEASFCVDAGNPASGYALESAPNGGRIDLGAFGNTPDASHSPATRFTLLVEPQPGATWFGTRTITWLTRGPWVGGDMVKLEFSADGGATWNNIAASVDYSLGHYDWNTTGLSPGANYFVRISKTDGTAMDVTDAAFGVSASGPRTYYVNDTNTLNDVFCSAPGSAANDGLTTATPKDSIQAILDTYKLVGGDTIKVDTGNYLLSATIVMTTNDVGTAGNPIVIQGSPNGTVLNRQNTGFDAFYLQGAEYVQFRNLKFTGGRYGLSGDGTTANYLRGVEIYNCETMTNGTHGFNFSYTSNLVISASSMHHNGSRGASLGAAVQVTIANNVTSFNSEGLWVDSSGIVSGNQCFSNSSRGLGISGTVLVSGNTTWRNGVGIQGWTSITVTNNLCFSNNYEGIYTTGSTNEVAFNRVFGNGRTGIYFEGSGRVRRNVVYSNGGHGIQFEGWSGDYREIVNNLCYLNGSGPGYFNIIGGANEWQGKQGLIENNTCYGGSGIYVGNTIAFTNRNNIIWATGSNSVALVRAMNGYAWGTFESDNNLIYLTDGAIAGQWNGNQAELADWQYATKNDYHSFVANPQFVNAAGADGIIGGTNGADDNFHLASTAGSFAGAPFTATASSTFTPNATTSPAIDAAMPSSSLGDEIAPNGSRRNLGAFGGTFDASLSPGTPGISILSLAANANLRGVKTLYWLTRGPWAVGETVRLEWSTDGGANWVQVPGADALPYTQTSYDWDTSSLTPGANYTVRLVSNLSGASQQIGAIRILPNSPTDFYVNDANPTNDVYCTAIGNESNSGLASSLPKATLKRLFRDYTLIAGDRVWIDTGYWRLDSTLQFFDSGSVAANIRFIGSTHPAGSRFDRGDNQQNAFLLSAVDHLSLESLKIVNSYDAIHIEGNASHYNDGVQVLGCELSTNYHYTVYFNYATNLTIANCDIHDNTYNGIYGGGYGVIRSNRVYRTAYYEAIRVWGGPLLVQGNQIFQNSSRGIYGTTLVTCKGNTVFSNTSDGIYLEGGDVNLSEALENRVFLNGLGNNGGNGIVALSGANAKRNVVYSNNGHGIYVDGYSGNFRVIANNLCYNNGNTTDYYNIYLNPSYYQGNQALLENNTCYGGSGIYIGDAIAVTNRNNIIWATGTGHYALVRYSQMDQWFATGGIFVSDNNCILATSGATLSAWLGNQNDLLEWRAATGQDTHSFSANPLFVNAAGADGILGGTNGLDDNFHLASTVGSYKGLPFTALTTAGFTADVSNSPCIDAGLPTSAIGYEQAPNGGRINLGAFGGTADASLSAGARVVELGLIAGGSVLRGTVPVNWWTHGSWQSNDTVLIEYSSNGGSSWATIPSAAALPFAQGVFAWDTSALTPGANYKVRITPNAGGTPAVSGLLRVLPNTAITFYLNDSSTTNDVYCTAVGSDANDGLTPATPMANLKRLTVTYKLMPGDTVRIDTGLWTLDANPVLTDSGAPGQLIRLVGSTNTLGSVFNRNDATIGMYGFHLKANHYMRLENLKVTGAYEGIYAQGSDTSFSQGIEIAGCEAYANNSWGILGVYCSNVVISACISRNNPYGLDVDGGGSGTISGNSVHDNRYTGIYLNGRFLADGNDCYNNGGYAFDGNNGARAYNNVIHENTGEPALKLSGVGCEAVGNRVYLNSGDGLYVNMAGVTRRNVVYSNGGHGITVDSWNGANTIINNLSYDNDRRNEGHWNIYVSRSGDIIQNNTLYGGNGLLWEGPWGDVARNNIIWAKGSGHYAVYYNNSSATPVSDFNNLYATDGANVGYWAGTTRAALAAWKAATGLDTNSLSADPLFVDPNGSDDSLGGFYGADDDFHLSSTAGSWHNGLWLADATNSPSIDAGDPSIMFTNEPYYNGLRVNQGAFGNTAEASKTAYSGAFYALNITLNPTNGGTVATWPPGVSNLYFPAGAAITATASNNLGFIWGSWSGAVSSTNTSISLVMNSNTPLTANFIAVMPHVLYRLEDSFAASIGTPPDLTNINAGLNFSTMTVRGSARRVLNLPWDTGLQLQPTLGVFPNQLYSIALLFKLDNVSGWRRLLDMRNGIDQGLYVHDGKLEFYPYSGASAVCVTNGNWHMVVLTHDVTGEMKVYCDGALQLTVTDSSNYGVVSSANTLRFFKDDGGDIGSGSVSRIHIFSRVLDASEVAALNALDDASPLITSPTLTGAAQGVPFLWPITGPGVATNLASGLPPGLGIDRASGLISGTATAPGVFDALITSTNGYGVSTQTLRIVVSASASLLFREDFNNGLAAAWTTVPTDTNYYNFQTGVMNLRANYGDTWTYYNRALNLFAVNTPTAGDFMITLGVARFTPSLRDSPGIFLVAWDDTDNSVRYGYNGGSAGRNTAMSIESHQTMTSSAGVAVDYGTNAFVMRLVKQGNMYSVSASTNGTDFAAITNVPAAAYANLVPRQLGFWMGLDPNQTDTMLIDYFEVSTTSPPDPIATWLASFGLTGTNANYNADPDKDGLKNIFEYAFNTNPTNAASVASPVGSVDNDHLVLTYRERTGGTGTVGVDYTAGGLTYTMQVANDLAGTWQSGTALVEQVGAAINNGDGTETVSVRIKQAITGSTQKFVRLVLLPTP